MKQFQLFNGLNEPESHKEPLWKESRQHFTVGGIWWVRFWQRGISSIQGWLCHPSTSLLLEQKKFGKGGTLGFLILLLWVSLFLKVDAGSGWGMELSSFPRGHLSFRRSFFWEASVHPQWWKIWAEKFHLTCRDLAVPVPGAAKHQLHSAFLLFSECFQIVFSKTKIIIRAFPSFILLHCATSVYCPFPCFCLLPSIWGQDLWVGSSGQAGCGTACWDSTWDCRWGEKFSQNIQFPVKFLYYHHYY